MYEIVEIVDGGIVWCVVEVWICDDLLFGWMCEFVG